MMRGACAALAAAVFACGGNQGSPASDGGYTGQGGGAPDAGTPPAGGPAVIAAGENATALALDAANVYWISENQGGGHRVRAAPKTGGPARTLSTQSGGSEFILSDGTYVFWTSSSFSTNDLNRIPVAGGAPQNAGSSDQPQFAMDDQAIYTFMGDTEEDLVKIDKQTLARTKLAQASGYNIAAGLGQIFWSDHDRIYAIASSGGAVRTVVAAHARYPQRLRVNGGVLLFRTRPDSTSDGSVTKVDPASGAAQDIAYQLDTMPQEIDANSGVVYWNDRACLGRVKLDGSGKGCVDSVPDDGKQHYVSVRADDSAVFFIRDGDVLRAPK